MNCPKCNTANAEEARFCKNCGTNIAPAPSAVVSDHKTITSLLIIIGIEYAFSLLMFVLQTFVVPYLIKNSDIDRVSLIYNAFGWVSDVVSLGVLLYFMVNIKNNKVKTALLIFFILKVIFMSGYRVMPLLHF